LRGLLRRRLTFTAETPLMLSAVRRGRSQNTPPIYLLAEATWQPKPSNVGGLFQWRLTFTVETPLMLSVERHGRN